VDLMFSARGEIDFMDPEKPSISHCAGIWRCRPWGKRRKDTARARPLERTCTLCNSWDWGSKRRYECDVGTHAGCRAASEGRQSYSDYMTFGIGNIDGAIPSSYPHLSSRKVRGVVAGGQIQDCLAYTRSFLLFS
jgi:hypothetical protein